MVLLRLTLKNIAAKKTLFVGTTLSVVLGVSFVVGVFITTDSMRASFGVLADDFAAQIDLRVRSDIEFGEQFDAPPVDPALATEIAATDGVAAVSGAAAALNVVVIKSDGEPVESFGPPQIGTSWSGESALSEVHRAVGRLPTGPGEFSVDVDTAEHADLVIGEQYRIQVPTGTRTFELVGTLFWGHPEENRSAGAQIVAFDLATATDVLNDGLGWDAILVDVASGVDADGVAAVVAEVLPPGVAVVTVEDTAEEVNDDFNSFVDVFQNILLAFAVVTMVVSAFLVNNVFSIVVGHRIRELGLLRALGATGTQVMRLVLGESAAVGLLASGLGIAGGIGVSAALKAISDALGLGLPIEPLQISVQIVVIALAMGVGVTVLASLAPALKARRVSPMAALRDDARLSAAVVRRRPAVGAAALAGAGVLLALGLLSGDWPLLIPLTLLAGVIAHWGGKRLAPWAGRVAVLGVGVTLLLVAAAADMGTTRLLVALALGVLATFVGINMTSALFARPLAQGLGQPLAKVDGVTGQLARQNAARNPRRTASTAAALMIGMALVVTVAVVAASMKTTLDETLNEQVNADWFLCVGNCNNQSSGFSPRLGESLEALAETKSVAAYRFLGEAFRTPDGEVHGLMAVSTADLEAHIDLDRVAGSVGDPLPGDLLVHSEKAEEYGLGVGDTLEVEVAGGERAAWTVAAVYDDDAIVGQWVVSTTTWDLHYQSANQDLFLSVLTADGVNEVAAATAIGNVAADYPQVDVRTQAEFRDSQAAQIDQSLIIVNVFLGLSFVIAVLGIIATLALSVFERTRELGLLRAVGMTRNQIRRMVCWEGLIVANFGGVLGVVLGLAFGALTAGIVPESVIGTVTIPIRDIGEYFFFVGLAGLLSGLLPAIQASRLRVLDAISHA